MILSRVILSFFLVLAVKAAQKCTYKLDTCPQRKSANKIYVGKKCTELTVNNAPCVIDQTCDKSTPFCVKKIGVNRNSELFEPSVVSDRISIVVQDTIAVFPRVEIRRYYT